MGLLSSVKKIANSAKNVFEKATLQGVTSQAIKKATGLSTEKQYGIGALGAAGTALLGGMLGSGAAGAAGGAAAGAAGGSTAASLFSGLGGLGIGLGDILGIGSNLAGGIIGANSAKEAAQISARQSAENTQKQIDWYNYVANNAHQMEVEDLRKAGLNPILSAGGSTAGAIAGNGISPQMADTSGYAAKGQLLMQGINSAIGFLNERQRISNETRMTDAETNLRAMQSIGQMLENKNLPTAQKAQLKEIYSRAAKNYADVGLTKTNTAKAVAETGNIQRQTQKIGWEIQKMLSEISYNQRKGSGKGFNVGTHGVGINY